MEWYRSDGDIVDSTVSYHKDSFPRAITSTYSQMINLNDHSVVYLCKTYFAAPIVDSQLEDSSTAKIAPDYNAECKVTVNVLCKLVPLFISGSGSFKVQLQYKHLIPKYASKCKR